MSIRHVGDVDVIDIAGRLTLGEGSSALRDLLRELIGKGQKNILLNCQWITRADPSLRGMLLVEQALIAAHGGTLKLFALSRKLRRQLGIGELGLYSAFDFRHDSGENIHQPYFDEPDAVRSFW
jgi:anti-sigma B factor antagonist